MGNTHRSPASSSVPAAEIEPLGGTSNHSAGLEGLPVDVAEASVVDALRRQVIALQRISSLGVLAGGVFHELNNALTPILNLRQAGPAQSRPGLS